MVREGNVTIHTEGNWGLFCLPCPALAGFFRVEMGGLVEAPRKQNQLSAGMEAVSSPPPA